MLLLNIIWYTLVCGSVFSVLRVPYLWYKYSYRIKKDRQQAIDRLNNMYKNNDRELIEIVHWDEIITKELDKTLNERGINKESDL